MEDLIEDNFKIVTLSYTETAGIVVKADNDDEASTAVHEAFPGIPDLKIISIEDAPADLVTEAKANYTAQEERLTKNKKALN